MQSLSMEIIYCVSYTLTGMGEYPLKNHPFHTRNLYLSPRMTESWFRECVALLALIRGKRRITWKVHWYYRSMVSKVLEEDCCGLSHICYGKESAMMAVTSVSVFESIPIYKPALSGLYLDQKWHNSWHTCGRLLMTSSYV